MQRLLLPWQDSTMLQYPWVLPIFIFFLSIILSIITWIRNKNK